MYEHHLVHFRQGYVMWAASPHARWFLSLYIVCAWILTNSTYQYCIILLREVIFLVYVLACSPAQLFPRKISLVLSRQCKIYIINQIRWHLSINSGLYKHRTLTKLTINTIHDLKATVIKIMTQRSISTQTISWPWGY